MQLDKIEDYEILYRAITKSNPDVLDEKGNPTPALFIDRGGLSVDRDGGRSETVIIETLIKRFDKRQGYEKAAKITAGKCRNIGTYPNPVGNKKNQYHAEIHESETEIEITLSKAMILANSCEVV